jgi:CRISPR-associated exonuclease Cas4
MYTEEDYIQLSSIQHYIFCPRQCGLIHVDALWSENLFTARGRIMHEKADSGEDESRGDKSIVRSLNVYSRRLGVSGRCDVVEMNESGARIIPYPVEYKSGKPKMDISDMAQLCAQALCLEEMMNVPIREAAIFYGKPRRRLQVEIDDDLRRDTESIIHSIHLMIKERRVPAAVYTKKCDSCSLADMCMPKVKTGRLKSYIEELYTIHEETP